MSYSVINTAERTVSVVLVLLACIHSPTACGQSAPPYPPCAYSVTTVPVQTCPVWGPMDSYPEGMNSAAHWVGHRRACSGALDVPLRWRPDTGLLALPLLPGTTYGTAYGISDAGMAVGHCDYHACMWPAEGGVQLIPVAAPEVLSGATATNSAGMIVGWKNVSAGPKGPYRMGFVWQNGIEISIDPSAYGAFYAEAWGVSDTGFVAGRLDEVCFRWKSGNLDVLVPLPGHSHAWAVGVNDAGTVVGHSDYYIDAEEVGHSTPTIWRVGCPPEALPLLPGSTDGACLAVSAAGQVLGWNIAQGVAGRVEVIWTNGIPTSIRPLIQGANPLQFTAARSINRLGQVLGTGSVSPPGGIGVWILSPERPTADLDGDCQVDGSDLAELLAKWGSANPQSADADLDGNGTIDGTDLGLLLGAWASVPL